MDYIILEVKLKTSKSKYVFGFDMTILQNEIVNVFSYIDVYTHNWWLYHQLCVCICIFTWSRFVYLYSVATTTEFIIIYHMYMKINIDRVLCFIYKINKFGQTKMRKTGNEPGTHQDSSHLLLLHQSL